jgi:hypothetical protein
MLNAVFPPPRTVTRFPATITPVVRLAVGGNDTSHP